MEAESPTITLVLVDETSLRTRQNTYYNLHIYDDKFIVSVMIMIVILSQWGHTREKANKGIGYCSNEMLE